ASPRNDVYGSVFRIVAPLSRLAMTGSGQSNVFLTKNTIFMVLHVSGQPSTFVPNFRLLIQQGCHTPF
ncbi:MAG: hypothetical protein LBE71_00940, partial [Dysgonamonadaceae bacterium]|nr:hypothetical protein [Dysgonamonadaceae bacterium]